jgi:CRP-like cAMP-binding protein
MLTNPSEQVTNQLLSRLSGEDFALLEPHLTFVDLPKRKDLELICRSIEHVYFPNSGIVSVVAGENKRGIEVGLIGREGMTGLAIVMGSDRSLHRTYVQSEGQGWRIGSGDLRDAMRERAAIHQRFLRYGFAFMMQTGYTAMANGRSKIEERLARWLLMAHDRTDGDVLTLTHDFLSVMLGVRRPGVTLALKLLENTGLIHTNRGSLTIVDREGLEECSNGAYGAPEAELKRLLDS